MAKETFNYKLVRQRESLMPASAAAPPSPPPPPPPATTTTTVATSPSTTAARQNDISPLRPTPAQPSTVISPPPPPPPSDSPKEPTREMSAKGKGKRPAREMDPGSEREKKREREEDEHGDARLQFRRCVYRAHTRMMGMPTQVLWHRLEPGGEGDPDYALEWDITGGK